MLKKLCHDTKIFSRTMYFERKEYLNKLISAEGNGMIKIITGIRRCGKSFLLFNIFRKYLLGRGFLVFVLKTSKSAFFFEIWEF